MPNKLTVVLSLIFLAIAPSYAASPEEPNSVTTDQNALQSLIDKANKGDANAQFALAEVYDSNPRLNVGLREISDLLQKAAEQGHAGAQYRLAHMYLCGTGRPQNCENAILWFSKAAEQGDPKSKFYAGLSYIHMALEVEIEAIISKKKDEGGKINSLKDKGAKYILSAKADLVQLANRNDPEAQYILARMTDKGLGFLQKEKEIASECTKKAIQELTVAANRNDIKAQRLLGEIFECNLPGTENTDYGIKWYTMAAEQGDPISQYKCGSYLLMSKNYEQALPWLLKATDRGHYEALHCICLTGSYTLKEEKNYAMALEWLEKAAKLGYPDAQYELAKLYDNGQLEDLAKALFWYRKAAEQGHQDSQFSLAMMYRAGADIPEDNNEAFIWFMKYAKNGSGSKLTTAQRVIGDMYFRGDGVSQNYEEALKWFTLAGERGDGIAQYWLGTIYYEGLGVNRNPRQAAKWYRGAANNGLAQYRLAQMYYRGEGVPQDYVEAYKWAILASIDGRYVDFRDQLKKEMTATQIEEGQKAAREFVAKKEKDNNNSSGLK